MNVLSLVSSPVDPAIAYDTFGTAVVGYAICARLLTYPDKAGAAGKRLVPEVAAALPHVTADGKSYTFTIKPDFRFSDGTPVTADNFAFAIERDLNPRLHSPVAPFLRDVVGAEAVLRGRAKHVSGVRVRGDTLSVRLTHAAPDFLARIAMNFFCAIPLGLPLTPKGVNTFASAGPYYVASRTAKRLELRRNPQYRGSRPHHLDAIVFTVNKSYPGSLGQVERGQADFDAVPFPSSAPARLAKKYGVNSSRFFVHPVLGTAYIALNTSRPLFRKAAVRQAVNFALDRQAQIRGIGAFAGTPTDQILPPGMPGFHDAKIYPLARPNLARAKTLMGGFSGKATLYVVAEDPVVLRLARAIAADLKPIGIDVLIKKVPGDLFVQKITRRNEPYDMTFAGFFADYPDPFDFINVLLYGKNIATQNNQNLAQFDDPVYNRRMEQASRLSGPRRYAAYGGLDVDIMKSAAPWVPVFNPTEVDFVSARYGCYLYQPVYGIDLAAACLTTK